MPANPERSQLTSETPSYSFMKILEKLFSSLGISSVNDDDSIKNKSKVIIKKQIPIELPIEIIDQILQEYVYLHENEYPDLLNGSCQLRSYSKFKRSEYDHYPQNDDYLTLSHVNRHFRSFFLPKVWKELFFLCHYQVKAYQSFLANTPNAYEVYGQHIHSITIFPACPKHKVEIEKGFNFEVKEDVKEKKGKNKELPEKNRDDSKAYRSIKEVENGLMYILNFCPNVYQLIWNPAAMSISSNLCKIIEQKCKKIKSFAIEYEKKTLKKSIYKESSFNIPFIDTKLIDFTCHQLDLDEIVDTTQDLTPSWVIEDERELYGFGLLPDVIEEGKKVCSTRWLINQLFKGSKGKLYSISLSDYSILSTPKFVPFLFYFQLIFRAYGSHEIRICLSNLRNTLFIYSLSTGNDKKGFWVFKICFLFLQRQNSFDIQNMFQIPSNLMPDFMQTTPIRLVDRVHASDPVPFMILLEKLLKSPQICLKIANVMEMVKKRGPPKIDD